MTSERKQVSELPPLALSIGSQERIPVEKRWGLSFSSRANVGFDKARVTVPVDQLVQADGSLIGDLIIWDTSEEIIVWQGYIERAKLVRQRSSLLIEAKGVGHELSRMKSSLMALNVGTPEIVRNVAAAGGLDPHVEGYSSGTHAYRVSKGIFGVRPRTKGQVGPQEIAPLVASDEKGVISTFGVSKSAHRRDAWSSKVVATTTVASEGFWEAMLEGGEDLFRGAALLQYQWLSGSARKLANQGPTQFRCYWRAPAVALSGSTLARRLDDAASMLMSRPRLHRRPRRSSDAEMRLAMTAAAGQLAAVERLPSKQREPLLDAVHLFVRATETADLETALLFFSGAVDRMAQLAPSRKLFSRPELKSLRGVAHELFGSDSLKLARLEHLIGRLNDAPWKERLSQVAEAKGVQVSGYEWAVLERLYKMRNMLVHEGSRPDAAINFQLRHGLAVLDRLIAAWLPWSD